MVLLQKAQHFLPGYGEHGPDQRAADRGNSPQPLQTGTPHQMHQHGLGVVIGGMGGGDLAGQPSQECVSGISGGSFQPLFARGDGGASPMEGDSHSLAEIPDKGLVPVGLRTPQAVVEMGCGQPDIQFIL